MVLVIGMATTTAPLVAGTFSALDRTDPGVASGVNNAMGQHAGLLAIAILPAAAGLRGVGLSSARLAEGTESLRIASALTILAVLVAAMTFASRSGPSGKMVPPGERAPS